MRSLLSSLTLLSYVSCASGFSTSALQGVRLARVSSPDTIVDFGDELKAATASKPALCILATYAADFNAIEYAQRVAYYLPLLRDRNVGRVLFVVNGKPDAARALAELVELPADVELYSDPDGVAGRAAGVSTGWRPDDAEMSPYAKLFGMLIGFGAWATLPAVIGGYIGNPFVGQPWVEAALAQGQRAGRWPNNALELDESGAVTKNKFTELPLVGSWPRRPLELATLRLMNMVDISIKNWDALRPEDEHLKVLTQLGGCVLLDTGGESCIFEHMDPGICAVCNFEDIIKKLDSLRPSGSSQIAARQTNAA